MTVGNVVRCVHGRRSVQHAHRSSRLAGALLAGAVTLSTFALAGCGAAPKKQAEAPAAYDWSDYKGTYAKGDDRAAAEPVKPKADAAGGAGLAKPSKGTIQGESVSSVTADTVAGASKTALKAKVVSSTVIVGREFEQVQVVMKGVSVQIIRPTATPDKAGPKLRSPKARSSSLLKSESGWYDADANVLVLVRTPKKASSQKALLALLQK